MLEERGGDDQHCLDIWGLPGDIKVTVDLLLSSSSQMSCRSIRFPWCAHALLLMCRLLSAPLSLGYSDSESAAASLPGALPLAFLPEYLLGLYVPAGPAT